MYTFLDNVFAHLIGLLYSVNITMFILFIYLFLAALGLHCCGRAGFFLVVQAGATLRCGAWASHCGGFSCCRARALGVRASAVVARGLSSCGSRALEHRLSRCGARV